MNSSNILITGSNGLVGQHIGIQLSNLKIPFLATSKGKNKIQHFESNYHSLDITKSEEIKNLFSLFKPKVVIHCAAMSQVDDCEQNADKCFETNVQGTKNLLETASIYKSKFIFLSTDFVFDGTKNFLNELNHTNPISVYGTSKLLAENLVKNYKYHWIIARTALVYGFADSKARSNILTWVYSNLQKNKSINVVNDQFRTPTYVTDLAMFCINAAQNSKAKGLFHVSGNEGFTVFEFAQLIAKNFNLNQNLILPIASNSLNQIGKRPLLTGFSINKAQKQLGFLPTKVSEALKYLSNKV